MSDGARAITGPILLVGCGKMGGALLAGWLDHGLSAADAIVVEPADALAEAVRARHGVTVLGDAAALDAGLVPRVVVLAVKPEAMDGVAPPRRALDSMAILPTSKSFGASIVPIQATTHVAAVN